MHLSQPAILIGVFLSLVCNSLCAQPTNWSGKRLPKSIKEFKYQNGKLVNDPNSNYYIQYNSEGKLIEHVSYNADSSCIDSLVYYPDGVLKETYTISYDGQIVKEYYPSGSLMERKIVDKTTREVLEITEYTESGLLLNDNNISRYKYDDQERLLNSVEDYGYYDLYKEYGYDDKGRKASVSIYHIKHAPQEVIFMIGASKGRIKRGMKNPFFSKTEQEADFDFNKTNVDRADIGILDVRPSTDLKSLKFKASAYNGVKEKEDFFLQPDGTIKKEVRSFFEKNEKGLIQKSLYIDGDWRFSKFSYQFDELGKLLETTEEEKVVQGDITCFYYKNDALVKKIKIRPDSSVIFQEVITIADGGGEVIVNHYEPYQTLMHTSVEKYKSGERVSLQYFDGRGKEINLEEENKSGDEQEKIVSSGKLIRIQPKGYDQLPYTKVSEFTSSDTMYTIVYQGTQKVGVRQKIYDEFGQLYQDVLLYPNGKVEGSRYDTTMYKGKLVKRARTENGEEVFCQKYAYDYYGELMAVYTYPEGEKKLYSREKVFYSDRGDTSQVLSFSAKDTVRINYFYERDKSNRVTKWGKTIEANGVRDTLYVANTIFKKKTKKQIAFQGKPVFKAYVDTVYRYWDEAGTLRKMTIKNMDGKTIKHKSFYANGQAELQIDTYGYEKYFFEDGSLKGHGRAGKFTELFDAQGRILFQRRSDNEIKYYKYGYRSKPIAGMDEYSMKKDSVKFTSEEDILDKSFKYFADRDSDNYVITFLNENEYLFENRVDKTKYIFRSEGVGGYPKLFNLYVLDSKVEHQDVLDGDGNWIERLVVSDGKEVARYIRDITYQEKIRE